MARQAVRALFGLVMLARSLARFDAVRRPSLFALLLLTVWAGFLGPAEASAKALPAETSSPSQAEEDELTLARVAPSSAHYERSDPTPSAPRFDIIKVEKESRADEVGSSASLEDATLRVLAVVRLVVRPARSRVAGWNAKAHALTALPRGPPVRG